MRWLAESSLLPSMVSAREAGEVAVHISDIIIFFP
jgi:hypothetical protein